MRKATKKEIELKKSKKDLIKKYMPKGEVIKPKKDLSDQFVAPSTPRKKKNLPLPFKGNPKNVLVVGDIHLPFSREGYLEFCHSMQVKHNAGTIIIIGDEVDLCAFSQYEKDPDGLSAGDEIKAAYEGLKDWFAVFPVAKCCIGNHTSRIYRKAKEAGIPKGVLKTYKEIWNAPKGWEWADSFDVHGVHYTHGTGTSGPQAAVRRAVLNQQSTVMGHLHSEASIQYSVSKKHKLFGMIVGCGVDDDAYAFHYGKDMVRKSVISCAVVLDGGKLPIIELMNL